jgi:diaminohydroxyphosphoribosylaminopyrimidine deaminase/5-amino-6-(5-phosphoribosylamino)uracil reductase
MTTALQHPTWIVADADADSERMRRFREAGVGVLGVAAGSGGVDVAAALRALGSAGITRLLVEGGAALAGSLLREGLVDRIAWFHAGAVMGGDGLPAVQGYGVAWLTDMPRFRHRWSRVVGGDMLTLFGKD